MIITEDLIEIICQNERKTIEASLVLSGCFATHFLRYSHRKLHDVGIDSEAVSWKIDEFLVYYPNALWVVQQIV
jgi:hypothetical protein